MSIVVKGARVPGRFRAALNLTLGCVLLSGCSSVSDRFSSASFGSGYGGEPTASETARAPAKTAANVTAPAEAQPTPYRTQPASGGYQLASATPGQTDGYMQVSRVDLPPLAQQQQQPPSRGTKLADGYGPYNQAPLPDGAYSGPRVYTPYDGPRSDVPPAYAPPPSGYYRPSDAPLPPAYAPREDARAYDPPSGGRGRAAEPPYYADGEASYSRAPESSRAGSSRPWSGRTDGETVAVAQGDTVYTLARRYGVTVDMIARANGLTSVYVRPGTKLFIPRADPASYAQAPGRGMAPQAAGCSGPRCHIVQPGETLRSIARAHGLSGQQLAEANNITERTLRPGQAIMIPTGKDQSRQAIASAERADKQHRGGSLIAPDAKAPPPSTAARMAEKGDKPGMGLAPAPLKPVPEVKTAELTPLSEPSCDAALANPQPRMGNLFRKPVDGRTIAQFGPQKDGTVHEGITISVPKGTPVKAAENGVVAYVGDELPGFGNLILIRHADEYVTAYAHADTVLVKKCDIVKRGQTVATAGTTGDATQPELHFEIRKNSKPIDPAPLMGS